MSATPPTSTHTLGAALERDRLERRVRRMAVVIGVLRQRENDNRRKPGTPRRHLGHAIADFEAQIEAMNTRVRDLGIERPSIETQRGADGSVVTVPHCSAPAPAGHSRDPDHLHLTGNEHVPDVT